jgi:hypothetical protein
MFWGSKKPGTMHFQPENDLKSAVLNLLIRI